MRIRAKLKAIMSTIVIASLALPTVASAAVPYTGYTWNTQRQAVHSINGYLYVDSIDGIGKETGTFKGPESLFIGPDDTLYLVDTGNNRIVHMDKNGKLIRTIGDKNDQGKLSEPKGVYVKEDGTVYVADTKNARVAVFNNNGEFVKDFKKPENPLLGANFSYSPSRLVVDKRDYMYVVSDGNALGLLQLDPNGEFKGFHGANHVGFSWARLIERMISTKEQQAQQARIRPSVFSDVVQDGEGFLYTTTLGEPFNQVKRLSPVGVDTLNIGNKRYGDVWSNGVFAMAAFMSISVDKNGFITILDSSTRKVFQYDKLGNFLFAFGGSGDQNGLFVIPSAVEQTSDGIIYVVDKGRNRIDRFRPTPFADLVHQASTLYVDGRYDEAEVIWHKILQLNSNYDMAYQAIGKSHYKAERYEEAMKYFKLGNAKGDYSAAFKEYRKEFIREHFVYFFLGAIFLLIFLRWGLPWVYRAIVRRLAVKPSGSVVVGKGETR